MDGRSHTTAFQADAFQFDAFQIFDESTIDDGVTKTIVGQKYITSMLNNLPADVTTSKPLPRNITS